MVPAALPRYNLGQDRKRRLRGPRGRANVGVRRRRSSPQPCPKQVQAGGAQAERSRVRPVPSIVPPTPLSARRRWLAVVTAVAGERGRVRVRATEDHSPVTSSGTVGVMPMPRRLLASSYFDVPIVNRALRRVVRGFVSVSEPPETSVFDPDELGT